jgi:hypothetical protein
MYQASSEPKQEREKQKRDEEKKPSHGNMREPTHIPKNNWEKKFQNDCEALAGVSQAEID